MPGLEMKMFQTIVDKYSQAQIDINTVKLRYHIVVGTYKSLRHIHCILDISVRDTCIEVQL